MHYKNILIAADESEHSKRVVNQGLLLAGDLNAKVTLIYIIRPLEPVGTIDSVIFPIEPDQSELDKGKDLLRGYLDENPTSILTEIVVKVGEPSDEILQFAKEWNADVIVIGRHGIESFKHLLFGGVVDYVATHTQIPVLLVP
jgi:nucleotide-binding universal stress UspA family protein